MSWVTAAERRRVTVFQWRSMNTKATTDCSTTIGTMMMSSERAYRPVGIRLLNQPAKGSQASETRFAATRRRASPTSIGGMSAPRGGSRGRGTPARTEEWGGGRAPRRRLAGYGRQHAQHVALAVGEMDDLLAAAKLGASDMEHEGTEAYRLGRRGGRRAGALEDIGDPQRQLARLERLGQIVVRADLEARDPALLLGPRGEHQDRHRGGGGDRPGAAESGAAPAP